MNRLLPVLLSFALVGCATTAPADPNQVLLAQEEQAGGEELPETDLTGFPTAPGLLPRDFVMKRESGDLKGYVTKFYRVRSLTGKDLVPYLKPWLSGPKASLQEVPEHNMLLITELPSNMPVLDKILKQIDTLRVQVEIEARIVEILETTGFEFGFELHVDRAPAGDTALRRYDGVFHSNSFLESLTSNTPFQGGTMNWASVGEVVEELGDFEFIMRALETEGYAEIVSSPRIVCRSGEIAVLKTTTELPFQEFILQSTNNPRITTKYKPVGVTLEVKPLVVGRDGITVNVKPSVSNVVRFEVDPSGGGIPVPVVATRSAQTTVDIRNGELLVIGGLLDKQIRTDERRVPLLGSIPLIGRLFTTQNDFEQKTQIVILLRIRILTSAEKARRRGMIPVTRDERTAAEEKEDKKD